MVVLELDYCDDPEINEVIDSDLIEGFDNNTYQAESCLIVIIGSSLDKERISSILDQRVEKNRIWFLGKSSLSDQNKSVRYIFFAILKNEQYIKICNIAGGTTSEKTPQLTSDFAELLWALLNDAKNYALEIDSVKVQLVLQQIKQISEKNFDPLLRAALNKALSEFSNLIDIDKKYYIGNETRSTSTLLQSEFLNELCYMSICNLSKDYVRAQNSVTGQIPSLIDSLKKRIDYLKVGKDLAQRIPQDQNNNYLSQLIFWYVGYFCSLVKFHEKRCEYSTALSLAVRVLELTCQSILLDENEADFNHQGKFFLTNTGEIPQGVMPLWKASKGTLNSSTYANYQQDIEDLIRLRNRTLFGHGVTHSNSLFIANNYISLLNFIENYFSSKKASVKLWRNLHASASVNVISEVNLAISQRTLENLALHD